MTNSKGTKVSKLKTYIAIIAVVLGITFSASVVSSIATYPTSEHRQNARELSVMDSKLFNGEISPEILDSEEYKSLSNNTYGQYSAIAGIVVLVLQFGLMVYVVGAIYRYIRTRRLTNHTAWVTTLLYSVAGIIAMAPTLLFDNWYTGYPLPSAGMLILTVVAAVIFGTLITYLVARIYQWYYNRKHSFIVD